jgi:nucleoside-diphosphate-sugar epimerase
MRVFLTGATGFIGSNLVPELISSGHQVIGLSRSAAGADALVRAGAEVLRGDVNDLNRLGAAAETADAVIHAAFNHDFTNLKQHSDEDRKVIETLGDVLLGSDRPLLVASGTGLVDRAKIIRPATEADASVSLAESPRAATEEAADAIVAKGGRVIVIRLSQVHDTHRQGRIAHHIKLARQKGWVAYLGEGTNRLAAVHVTDAVRLFRLALERGRSGDRYHAVAEEGVAMLDIAKTIGTRLNLPVRSIASQEAADYFGPIAGIAAIDMTASSTLTRQRLAWSPIGPDLLTDLRNAHYGEAA